MRLLEVTRLSVKLPARMVTELWGSAAEAQKDVQERAVLSLFADGRISAGKAAELLGTTL